MTAKRYSNLDVWKMGAENTAKLLNELHEENENLKDFAHHNYSETKKIINNLQKENEQLQHDATILIQSNQDYRKENEQLKKQNDNLVNMIARVQYRADLIKEENENLKKEILWWKYHCGETIKKELEE